MKVRDLLQYYARLKGFRDSNGEINFWLNRLGAADWATRKIETLSKGMTQKVQFMAAVIARPKLLILDEPFSGLDPINLELLRDAILEIRSRGATIIFSTHEMDMAERLCERVFMIHNGNKVLDGTVGEIQKRYPADEVRVRLSEGQLLPDDIPGVQSREARGAYVHLKLQDGSEANALLKRLANESQLEHFELLRPSLHNIFIRMAGPEAVASKLNDTPMPSADSK